MEIHGSSNPLNFDLHGASMRGAQAARTRMADHAQALGAGDIRVERVVGMQQEAHLYSINLQLLKMADEMVGQVLDLLA